VGEFERAFTDRQFEQVARLLQRDGMLVWLPEAGGPVDLIRAPSCVSPGELNPHSVRGGLAH
jgi:hypothetical protein